jgi:hypothetical protein
MSRAFLALLLCLCACASTPPPRPTEPSEAVAKATHGATRVAGLVPLWRREDGSLLAELSPALLDHDLGLVLKVSRGLAGEGLNDGLLLSDTRVVRFVHVGGRVLLFDRNLRARAQPGSGWERAVTTNAGDSVLAALPVVAAEGTTVYADLTGFVVSDYADLADGFQGIYEPKASTFDEKRSVVAGAAGYPRNVEIDTLLTYVAPTQPAAGIDIAADGRAVTVGVRYSIFALPEQPLATRAGDDRVGFFSDLVLDPARGSRQLHAQIRRRRLEKRDPSASRSPPIAPIVYVLDPSIPPKWRPIVREGILAWNRAFEEAGFIDAIVVRDAGDDPDYRPDDVRYSTVRWANNYSIATAGMGFHHVDPRSGEILGASVVLLGGVINTPWYDLFRELAGGGLGAGCGGGAALAVAQVLLAGRPGVTYDSIAGDYLRITTMHEIGHTLGLSHNFRASASVSFDRLFDPDYVAHHGTIPSVMDYAAGNVVLDAARQPDLFDKEVGPYDRWAIQFGYSTFAPDQEAAGLAAILDRAADPELAFGSDADVWMGDLASDPQTQIFDLGDDPVRWARLQVALMTRAMSHLRESFMTTGESYFTLRTGFDVLLVMRQMAMQPLLRSVGGFSVNRDHLGQKGERPPLSPIAWARQRAALAAFIELLLAEDANRFPRDVLEHLAPYRGPGWPWYLFRVDIAPTAVAYPLEQTILALQGAALTSLLHPARLQRLEDGAAFGDAQPLTVAELFATLTDGIFTELLAGAPRAVSAQRRDLQALWVERLGKLERAEEPAPPKPSTVSPTPWHPAMPPIPVPADARAAARAQLRRLEARLAAVRPADELTRAHVALLEARVKQALAGPVPPRP